MKNNIYTTIFYLLIISFFLPMQSCSIIGLMADSAANNKNDNKSGKFLVEGPGWVQPDNLDYQIELTLSNRNIITGQYCGIEYIKQGNETFDLALVKVKKSMKSIPTHHIAHTRIMSRKENRSHIGFAIGLTFDIVILMEMVNMDGWISFGDLNWN